MSFRGGDQCEFMANRDLKLINLPMGHQIVSNIVTWYDYCQLNLKKKDASSGN